ncbi:MAG: pantoate--beta-alanine ligase [Pseudomonadales bacterium]|nr:pantoate--beta-alanine ligase [Pseudomonadales bacterium]
MSAPVRLPEGAVAGDSGSGIQVFRDLTAWSEYRQGMSGSIGFVATMGALHAGHASLIERSRAENDQTVLSIYLNPTQFNNPQDLEKYPRTLERDLRMACALGVDAVITPTGEAMYADSFRYQVEEKTESNTLCGRHRPGHFTGVLTVVMKLLNLVRPDRAYFGEKDFQQYELIRDMCAAFFMAVDIVPCAIVREPDGLAMSSRNELLDAPSRARAGQLNVLIRSDLDDAAVMQTLTAAGFDVDYVVSREGRRFAAASLRSGERVVRLIDNVVLSRSGWCSDAHRPGRNPP